MAFTLVSASYFLTADGKASEAKAVKTTAGAFAFASGEILGHTMAGILS